MKKEKIEKLKAAGFEVGNTASFLKLTSDEVRRVEAIRAGTKLYFKQGRSQEF